MTNIVWFRRDLKLQDNASLSRAIHEGEEIQPIFIFDTEILERFTDKKDRRISFIANTLQLLHEDLEKAGGGLLVLAGNPREIVPELAKLFKGKVFAGEDYEPSAITRDKYVASKAELVLSKQHVLLSPSEVLKENGEPYKVFTPYSKMWNLRLNEGDYTIFKYPAKGNLANFAISKKLAHKFKIIDISNAEKAVEEIGYKYVKDDLWHPKHAKKVLKEFESHVSNYTNARDIPAVHGTSKLSPYLRFGLVTVRECYNLMRPIANSYKWISELIWREFYAMIIFHYPNTVKEEFLEQYRNLKWSHNQEHLEKWQEGKTGYAIVDAGMRQLNQEGWMHNRVRMIVASFLTKDLLIDWRFGEEYFAQKLMDYDQASNVGGWQWASSTGTDAAPYFRVFNPSLQSKRFDPKGEYIRKYVPELADLNERDIHLPRNPVVDHDKARKRVLEFFKKA